jgi:hypothetical protein
MRLAAYYDGRAQALALTTSQNNEDVKRFAALATILAAEKIAFGKKPSTPAEQLIELLKAAKSTTESIPP